MQSEPASSVCLLCCESSEIFILPQCNHKQICWKCCMKLIKAGKFECPFCREGHHEKQKIIFVSYEEMNQFNYIDLLSIKNSPIQLLKSEKNSNYYYSSVSIAQKIEYQTSYSCPRCQDSDNLYKSLNELKKHLDQKHSHQYCDICLLNRKCIQSEQILYSDSEYQRHLTKGEFTQTGDLILYHPRCDFCRQHFYDIDEFRRHLEKQHYKCEICHKNLEELKYVYFKDYEQATAHFKKSHFYCQTGNCLNTRYQNVFVSQEAFNDHTERVHKKTKKSIVPVMNMILGFNKTQDQQHQQWDKIGQNYLSVFQRVQKHANVSRLHPVQHQDSLIDIRDFYPQQWKKTISMSLPRIKDKIEDKLYDFKDKKREIYVTDIDFFKPLEMPPLTRVELEKFLNLIFEPKIAHPIISYFFHGRQDFKSFDEYFGFVRCKMCSYDKIAYYYAFPQLIRFFKNENPHKAAMQRYYYESLHELKVKKMFIIHTRSTYSDILKFLKQIIEKQMEQRFKTSMENYSKTNQKKQLDIEIYKKFLNDLNSNFYIENQQDIFYVSKDKMTNLYHMIYRCSPKEFLKMNWLLKIGFNNQAYKVIQKHFYYNQEKQSQNAMKKLNIQELAYIYAYCTVCLQSIFQKILFKEYKSRSFSFFLSNVLMSFKNIKNDPNLSIQYFAIVKMLIDKENKSKNMEYHVVQNKNKGIIVNQNQYESLLNYNTTDKASKNSIIQTINKQNDFPELKTAFGTHIPKFWNQNNSNIVQKQKIIDPQQYPSILSNNQQSKKWEQKKEEEDFPVYHFVGKKNKNKTMKSGVSLNQFQASLGWNSGFVPNQWNEDESKKSWDKRLEDEERRIQRQKQLESERKKNEGMNVKNKIVDNFITPKTGDKVQEKKQQNQAQQFSTKPQTVVIIEPMMISKGKKSIAIDEFLIPQTKKKQKKENKKKIIQQSDEDEGLFEKIQKQSNLVKKKEEKRQIKNEISKVNKRVAEDNLLRLQKKQYIYLQKYVPDNGQFPSLGSNKPIINEKEQKKVEEKIPIKKKNKKIRLDDTSSDQEKQKQKKKIKTKLKQQKKQTEPIEQFVSISSQFKKQSNDSQKMSKVNEIIQAAKIEQLPENQIKIKKGRNGKKQIIERVNFFAL